VVQIRGADEGDIDDLLAIEEACFSVYYYGQYKFDRGDFRYYLRRAEGLFPVAVAGGRVVGYAVAVVRRSPGGRLAHIDSIGVLPEEQGKGIGGRLLQTLLDGARSHRCSTAVLEVAAANTAGRAFFERCGFREVRELPNYYGRGLDGVLMVITLD